MKINKGKIEKNIYVKYVSFSKAVLWMTKELSLRINIIEELKIKKIKKLYFIDKKKKERWSFKLEDVLREGEKWKYGQETQWYFPIHLAVKSSLKHI